ncbi:hypothetical protein ACRAWD_26290 [Caulobacter segnis]
MAYLASDLLGPDVAWRWTSSAWPRLPCCNPSTDAAGAVLRQVWRACRGMAACAAFILAIVAVSGLIVLLLIVSRVAGLFVGFIYAVMGRSRPRSR